MMLALAAVRLAPERLESIAALTLIRGTSLLQFPVQSRTQRRDSGQVQPSLEEPFSPIAKV